MKRLFFGIAFFALVVGLAGCTVVSGSVKQGHGAHPSSAATKVTVKSCDDINIRCAKTVTATVSESGRIWFAWVIGEHLYVNYSDDRGGNFSSPVEVNKKPERIAARGENRPKIALDSMGNVYLSWVKRLPKKWTSDIRFAWSNDQGESFSPPVTVNDDNKVTGHSFNEMVVTESGEVTLVWLDGRHALAARESGEQFIGSSIYWAQATPSRSKSSQSESKGWENRKHIDSSCVCCRLALALRSQKVPVLMWRHIYEGNIRDHALAELRTKPDVQSNVLDGIQTRRVSFENWKIDGCPHHGPAIAIQESVQNAHLGSRTHLSWFSDSPRASGLFYAYTDTQGETLSPVFPVADKSSLPSHPSLISGRGRGVTLAWQEFDGKFQRIKKMHSADGVKWGAVEDVAHYAGKTDYPFLLSHPEMDLLLWHKPGQPLILYEVQ